MDENEVPVEGQGIGTIGNYYGGLRVKQEADGKCYWGIESWDGVTWEEIPKTLYQALVRFGNRKERQLAAKLQVYEREQRKNHLIRKRKEGGS